jgi:cytochrome c biogenesis protein CcmG/thiol:disulfide interchange protein DsbE
MKRAAALSIAFLASCLPSTNPLPAPGPSLIGRTAPEHAIASVMEKKTSKPPAGVRMYLFGSTWCGECGEALIKLDFLRDKYASRGVTLVGVAEDESAADVRKECKRLETTTPMALDTRKEIAGEWHVSTLPTLFVVDRGGTIRFVHTGFRDGDEFEVEDEVEQLLP